MAEKFGWTLDYIDDLSFAEHDEYEEFLQVVDAIRKAQSFLRAKK